jgi:DNA-directed RNA polymerase specialized sigma24 family protein
MPAALDDLDAADDGSLSETKPSEERMDSARERAKARHVLAQMSEPYSLMLLWRYWEQCSTRDIAIAIGEWPAERSCRRD